MVLAVLEKKAGIVTSNLDVYVSTVGGVRFTEPAADLAIAIAVAGSVRNAVGAADARRDRRAEPRGRDPAGDADRAAPQRGGPPRLHRADRQPLADRRAARSTTCAPVRGRARRGRPGVLTPSAAVRGAASRVRSSARPDARRQWLGRCASLRWRRMRCDSVPAVRVPIVAHAERERDHEARRAHDADDAGTPSGDDGTPGGGSREHPAVEPLRAPAGRSGVERGDERRRTSPASGADRRCRRTPSRSRPRAVRGRRAASRACCSATSGGSVAGLWAASLKRSSAISPVSGSR